MSTKNLNERIEEFYNNLLNLVNENKLDQKIEYIVSPNIKDGEKLLKLDSLITSKQFFKKWLYRNIQTEEQLLEIEKQIFEEM